MSKSSVTLVLTLLLETEALHLTRESDQAEEFPSEALHLTRESEQSEEPPLVHRVAYNVRGKFRRLSEKSPWWDVGRLVSGGWYESPQQYLGRKIWSQVRAVP